MKEEYTEIIKKQLEACNDVSLLHLIATLLDKEGYSSTIEEKTA